MINFNCLKCINYYGVWACKAFEEGIPPEIQSGENDHTLPFENDNGIQFELDKKFFVADDEN